MESPLSVQPKRLYELDYYQWIEETVKQLQNKEFEAVDWDNLIDEVADLGRREKRKLENLLTRLLENLFKLKYWTSQRAYNENHWKAEIRNFRKQIKRELKASPSLNNYLQEIFAECHQDALEIFAERSQISIDKLLTTSDLTLQETLEDSWFPNYWDN